MHSHKAYHLDIKLGNILVGEDYQLKLADFDGSYLESEDQGKEIRCLGTSGYRAPEMVMGSVENLGAADIYSAAITLFAMKTGVFPFLEDLNGAGISELQKFHD